MLLEIVTHCWQFRYSRLLIYQLSSLFLHVPETLRLQITVFYTRDDPDTSNVVDFFQEKFSTTRVEFRPWVLPKEKLLRRLIGRNLAALETKADWIWFTDCDHLVGENSLDCLPAVLQDVGSPLVFPRTVLLHENHALGEAAVRAADGPPRVLRLPDDPFTETHYRRAIGGVQIVRGEIARQIGYCKDSRKQNWTADTWQPMHEDRHFRVQLGTPGTPVEIPNVYRLRHEYE